MAAQDSKTILSAWLVAVGLTAYRGWVHRVDDNGHSVKAPPAPGEMLKTVGFFGLVALLNEMVSSAEAHRALALLGWGVDIAALINLVGGNATPIKGGSWPPPQAPDIVVLPGQGGGGADTSKSGGQSGGSSKKSSTPWWVNVPGANIVGKVFGSIF